MKTKAVLTILIFALALCFVSIGCRKQKTTLDTPAPAKSEEPTQKVETFSDVDTTDEATFREAQLSEELAQKLKEKLTTIYFDYNSSSLSQDALMQLSSIGQFLKENAGIRILIEGHCDERGSSEYNMGLGDNRARTVRDYLINYGIQAIRVESTSLGKEQPASPFCHDDECHSKNRRAEFKALAR